MCRVKQSCSDYCSCSYNKRCLRTSNNRVSPDVQNIEIQSNVLLLLVKLKKGHTSLKLQQSLFCFIHCTLTDQTIRDIKA